MDSPSKTIDSLKFDKENAMARFNRVRRVTKLLQIIVFAAVSWCLPAVAAWLAHLCNQHAAFLFGNAIIMLLFVLCRHGDGGASAADLYDDFGRDSEAARAPPPEEIGDGGCEKQIAVDECDDVAKVIEKAARQMKKFQRNRSEMTLRREIVVRPELRRSETENSRKMVNPEAEIEKLSSEEFQRRVDAFIDKHWIKTTPKLE